MYSNFEGSCQLTHLICQVIKIFLKRYEIITALQKFIPSFMALLGLQKMAVVIEKLFNSSSSSKLRLVDEIDRTFNIIAVL